MSRLARSIKECERFLSPLNLPLLFQPRDRYEVRSASPPMAEHAGGGSATDDRVTRSRPYTSPANEGWPAAPIGSTVLHCPLDISGPSLPAHPRPLFPLRSAEQAHGTGTPWNVSLDGCRISTHVSLQAGTKVGLVILLPQPIGAMLVKTATVCWTRGPECGLRLERLHLVEAARLQEYVTRAVSEAVHAESDASTMRSRVRIVGG